MPILEGRNPNFEASNPDFEASDPKFEASDPDFDASDPKFEASNPDFDASDPGLGRPAAAGHGPMSAPAASHPGAGRMTGRGLGANLLGRVLIGLSVLALLAVAAGGWSLRPRSNALFTDHAAIRRPVEAHPARDVLWTPPVPVEHDRPDLEGPAAALETYEPVVSDDGRTMIWVRGRAGGRADLWMATRAPGFVRGAWSEPWPLTSINTGADELGPEPSADGSVLYFYSDRPGGFGGYDLWMARRDARGDGGWSEPVNLGPSVNSAWDEYGPALAPDGARLLFTSDRPDDPAQAARPIDGWPATMREALRSYDDDLYEAPITERGIGVARRLDVLSGPADDGSAAFSPAGDFVWFASDRPGGLGGFDLYRARIRGGVIGEPERIGPDVNGPHDELDPALSMGGFRLHFSSDRPAAGDTERAGDPGAERTFRLFESTSREVEIVREPVRASIPWADLLPWLLWLLLALLSLLLLWLLLRTMRSDRVRRMSLLMQCLLASLLAHALLAILLGFWGVQASVSNWAKDGEGTRVVIASPSVGRGAAAQLRGAIMERPAIDAPALDAAPRPPADAPMALDERSVDAPAPPTAAARVSRRAIGAAMATASSARPEPANEPDAPALPPPPPDRPVGPASGLEVATPAAGAEPPVQRSAVAVADAPRPAAAAPPMPAGAAAEPPPVPITRADADAPLPAAAPAADLAGLPPGPTEFEPSPPVAAMTPAISALETALPTDAPPPASTGSGATEPDVRRLADAGPTRAELAPAPSIDAPVAEAIPAPSLAVTAAPLPSVAPPAEVGFARVDDRPSDVDASFETGANGLPPLVATSLETALPTDAAAGPTSESVSPSSSAVELPTRRLAMERALDTDTWDTDTWDADTWDADTWDSASAPAPPAAPAIEPAAIAIDPPAPAGPSPAIPNDASVNAPDVPSPAVATLEALDLAALDVASPEETAAAADDVIAAAVSRPRALDDLALSSLDLPAPAGLDGNAPGTAPAPPTARPLRIAGDAGVRPLEIDARASGDPPSPAPLADAQPPDVEPAALAAALALPRQTEPPPNPYAQRDADRRRGLVERLGGDERTERAVADALAWLARQQRRDGRWHSFSFDDEQRRVRANARVQVDIALTALATLCFLGADHTHLEDGPYRDTVTRAVDWLVDAQADDGGLMTGESLYSHGIATIALAEAYGMTGDGRLREPVERAIGFLVEARNRGVGGWRYAPGQPGDTSVLGWQVMAMASAEAAGVEVPAVGFETARRWLATVSDERVPGRWAYQPGQPPSPAMTAESMFIHGLLGTEATDPALRAGARWLLEHLPHRDEQPNTYYWYYGSLALFQQQGPAWGQWNERVKRELLATQIDAGPDAGSWDTRDRWSVTGGKIYQTAICCLTLEVYYRYLPNYLRVAGDTDGGTSAP